MTSRFEGQRTVRGVRIAHYVLSDLEGKERLLVNVAKRSHAEGTWCAPWNRVRGATCSCCHRETHYVMLPCRHLCQQHEKNNVSQRRHPLASCLDTVSEIVSDVVCAIAFPGCLDRETQPLRVCWSGMRQGVHGEGFVMAFVDLVIGPDCFWAIWFLSPIRVSRVTLKLDPYDVCSRNLETAKEIDGNESGGVKMSIGVFGDGGRGDVPAMTLDDCVS